MDATSESKRKLSVSSSGSMPEINGYASKRKSKIPVTTPKSKADNSGNMSSPPAPSSLSDVNAASMGGGKPTGVQSSSALSTGKQEAPANVSNDDSFKTVENRRRRSRGRSHGGRGRSEGPRSRSPHNKNEEMRRSSGGDSTIGGNKGGRSTHTPSSQRQSKAPSDIKKPFEKIHGPK